MPKYSNTVFYDFKFRFLVVFSSKYRHRPALKIPFPDHIFPKILRYRTENLHFLSNGKYYFPLPPRPQKQSFPDILQNRCYEKFHKFHRKASVLEYLFNKVVGLKTCNVIKKRLQHRWFHVKFAKFSRTHFFKEHLWWPLLKKPRRSLWFIVWRSDALVI